MFDLCTYFNKQVKIYDRIKEDLHYFRLKLNRCPETLDDMIKTINAADDINDKWIMCSPEKGRFHMFGKTGAYNIKFISSNNTDNIYEAVYDKYGNRITENDDNGKNMGTYNYASSSKDASTHTKFDVNTYEKWGFYKYSEPRYKGKTWLNIAKVDENAKNHYIDVCNEIGVDYDFLLYNNFSIM